MEWILEPTAWIGLATLVALEIVLGIDNLIFIAILSDKLAPHQRKRARLIGLSLALVMRLFLLTTIAWMTKLTDPLFNILGGNISGRDLIMLVGGAFLLFKGTRELHEKLEGSHDDKEGDVAYTKFWHVVAQIVVLDAVFSLDAVITAVGMTEHLSIMMLAVCIAIGLMIVSANPLMNFVSSHPTVIILCLGFLLMIGFSLIVDGLGYHIPKGYLYAAIGFSVAIEALNQLALRNRRKDYYKMDARLRLSQVVLGLLGARNNTGEAIASEVSGLSPTPEEMAIFTPQERLMMGRLLRLGEMNIDEIMTPRRDLYWIDITDDKKTVQKDILECTYSCIVATDEKGPETPIGTIYKKDLANYLIEHGTMEGFEAIIRQPVTMPNTMTILAATEIFRKSRIHEAFIVDEYGSLDGMVTLTDITEAILGDMPEEHLEDGFRYQKNKDGSWTFDGSVSLQDIEEVLGDIEFPEGDYHTAAGILLTILKRLPEIGDTVEIQGWTIRAEAMDGHRISRLKFSSTINQ